MAYSLADALASPRQPVQSESRGSGRAGAASNRGTAACADLKLPAGSGRPGCNRSVRQTFSCLVPLDAISDTESQKSRCPSCVPASEKDGEGYF